MTKFIRIHGVALLAVILTAAAARAQQTGVPKTDGREQPVEPFPAAVSTTSASDSPLDMPEAPTGGVHVAADDHPLSGVQEQTVGPNAEGSGGSSGALPAGFVRNFILPSINATSGLLLASSGSGYNASTYSYLLGSLDLHHASDRSDLLVHYTGGGMLSSYINSGVQDLDLSYEYNWQRWALLAGGEVNYLSQSPFGFGGVGGLAFLNGDYAQFGPGGALGTILNSSLTPNQTIPTIVVPRISSVAVSQIEYKLSPRSSWTASGSFGMLNFLGADYIDSAQARFQTGYNYLIDPASRIAAIYRFDDFRFTYLPQTIEDHVMEIGYGRYVTGRLSFQVAAGPSVELLRGFLTGYGDRISWALEGFLNYRLDRTTFLLNYSHLVTGGSGVLVGAQTSQVQATVQRRLNLRWQASATMGYASNSSLVPNEYIVGNGFYNSWYATFRFDHQWGPRSSVFMSYGAQLQAINGASCSIVSGITNCGGNTVGHTFSVGFNFDFRPMRP